MLLNMNMVIRKRIILSLSALAFLSMMFFVSRNLLAKNENLPNELMESVNQYYQAEKNRNWEEAYNLRDKSFKELVKFKDYKRIMDRDSEGWQLLKYKVLNGHQKEDDKYYVELKILDKPPKDQKMLNKTIGSIESIEKTLWVLEGDKWKVQTPGTRNYLSLNQGMNVSIDDPIAPSPYTKNEYQNNRKLTEETVNIQLRKKGMDNNLSDKVNVGQFDF